MEKKYLEFFETNTAKEDRKTKTFLILNKTNGEQIGEIKWAGNWRKYASEMCVNVIVDSGCHRELAEFLDKLMDERRTRRRVGDKMAIRNV